MRPGGAEVAAGEKLGRTPAGSIGRAVSNPSYTVPQPLFLQIGDLQRGVILVGTSLWGPPLCRHVNAINAIQDTARLRHLLRTVSQVSGWDALLRGQ